MSVRSVEMLEFYDATNRPLDREASISIEMLRYFVPMLKEKGYDQRASEVQQEMERIFGASGRLRMNR